MTFAYADQVSDAGKSDPRRSPISCFIIHHAATVGAANTIATLTGPRNVSANAIGTPQGIIAQVSEDRRAWTSGATGDGGRGAAFDHKALTIEIANDVGAPAWTAAPETLEHVAQWLASKSAQYGVPLDREHVIGHRELYEHFRASYPTECPGGINLDNLVTRSLEIQTTKEETELMPALTDEEQRRILQHLDNINYALSKIILPALGRIDTQRVLTNQNDAKILVRIDALANTLTTESTPKA